MSEHEASQIKDIKVDYEMEIEDDGQTPLIAKSQPTSQAQSLREKESEYYSFQKSKTNRDKVLQQWSEEKLLEPSGQFN